MKRGAVLKPKDAAYTADGNHNAKAEDIVKVGEEIETYIVRVNDVEGTVMLSKKRLEAGKAWEEVEAAAENKPKDESKKPSFDLDELERRMMLDDSVI